MKLFGSDTNSGIIWKILDWFGGMNFNPKLSPGESTNKNWLTLEYLQIEEKFY